MMDGVEAGFFLTALYQKKHAATYSPSGIIHGSFLQYFNCKLRLEASKFEMTKNQRQALVKFLKFIGFPEPTHSLSRQELFQRISGPLFAAGPEIPGSLGRFSISFSRSSADLEHFDLFKRYQMVVHSEAEDTITFERFFRFLQKSPLPPDGNFGTWHADYCIDNVLFATSIFDLWPNGLSSAYCFYDPEMRYLSPGIVSCLIEIALTAYLGQINILGNQYYHLGYYLESCQKLRYKACFGPYQIFDQKAQEWR